MTTDRRPSPELQVRASLAHAKREGIPAGEAWLLATTGNVCDSYTSARGGKASIEPSATHAPGLRAGKPTPIPPEPDDPEPAPNGGQKRCAGCRFVEDAGDGVAWCALYDHPVYSGVLWPHRTAERHEWQRAILGTWDEWLAAYDDEPTGVGLLLDMLAARDVAQADEDLGDVVVRADVAA